MLLSLPRGSPTAMVSISNDAEHLHDLESSSSSLDLDQIEEDYHKKYGVVYERKKKRNKQILH